MPAAITAVNSLLSHIQHTPLIPRISLSKAENFALLVKQFEVSVSQILNPGSILQHINYFPHRTTLTNN